MQDELPLALIEEKAESEIAADDGHEHSSADGFDEPDGIDCFGSRRRLRRMFRPFWVGAGHEGFSLNFSICHASNGAGGMVLGI